MINKHNTGFTLLETIIFIFMISLIFVSLVYASALSTRNNRRTSQKIIATHYAEELREWLRGQKESDWPGFLSKASAGGITYCFNSNLSTWPAASSCSLVYSLNNNYLRETTLISLTDGAGNAQVRALITVSFKDGKNVITSKDNALFAPWE